MTPDYPRAGDVVHDATFTAAYVVTRVRGGKVTAANASTTRTIPVSRLTVAMGGRPDGITWQETREESR